MSAQTKMTAARTALVLEQPFFGALALSLKMSPDPGCQTAWVDGRTLGYEPAFIESLTHEQRTALIGHEVMHCALGHPWRREGRGMKRWNIACDKAINSELRAAGFTLPPDAYYSEGDEVGKSAEWIAARLPDEGDGDGQGKGQGDGAGDGQGNGQAKPDPLGEVRDAPTGADADGTPEPTEQEWKQRAAGAAQQAKLQGMLPGGMERLVQQALRPRIDVRSLLLRFFSERSTGDYSWSRPNPRYLCHGLYLPALESKALGEVAILADTSGSMDSTALDYTRGIVEQVLEEVQPAGTTLYMVDARVHNVHRMERGEPLTWEPKGGEGTNFTSFFEQVERGDVQPVCIIGITDLCATFGPAPSVPVLWLSTTEGKQAPFGEVVFVDR